MVSLYVLLIQRSDDTLLGLKKKKKKVSLYVLLAVG